MSINAARMGYVSDGQAVAKAAGARQRGSNIGTAKQTEAPTSNTGRYEQSSTLSTVLVMQNGQIKEIPVKKGVGTAAHIDALTITMPELVFNPSLDAVTDDEVAGHISGAIYEIMGYGLSSAARGRNGYSMSYLMGTERVSYGYVAFGGSQQRETVCIHFTGTGLMAAQDGWEHRLYQFLQDFAPNARITRCDLAHDFIEGEYTPEQALKDWESGLFTSRYTKPVAECVGSDWLSGTNRGKTLYIGSRKSSKYCRIYEKGKEQGDEQSKWVRFELELKNKDIIIPHDILTNPGQYLTGAYPICEQLFKNHKEQIARIELKKKQETVGIEHCQKYASMQASGFLNYLHNELNLTKEEVFDFVVNPVAKVPKRLDTAVYFCNNLTVPFMHERRRLTYSIDELLDRIGDEFDSKNKCKLRHMTFEEYKNAMDADVWKEARYYMTPQEILNPKREWN
ncbi:replication initiation factor domain-containing protein [Snodgrassella communis]|uniref:replication initiation factor domain-containing protein n=1 Tax=Snodgrassella communis TaxID=2946699 RepID=UPI001EF4B72C|nr:replication initiation factor domain-containing protein [Snodgrassella communis]